MKFAQLNLDATAPAAQPSNGIVLFCGLNPSSAGGPNAGRDGLDPTMRREVAFAKSWGYAGGPGTGAIFSSDGRYRYVLFAPGLVKINLFALVSTQPGKLLVDPDPIGHDNDAHIANWVGQADLIVCAWGAHSAATLRPSRAAAVLRLIRALGKKPHALAVTGGGQPGHPLYLKAGLLPVPYEGGGA